MREPTYSYSLLTCTSKSTTVAECHTPTLWCDNSKIRKSINHWKVGFLGTTRLTFFCFLFTGQSSADLVKKRLIFLLFLHCWRRSHFLSLSQKTIRNGPTVLCWAPTSDETKACFVYLTTTALRVTVTIG